MKARDNRLQLKQLDKTLANTKRLMGLPVPRKGWLRAIRSTLNMSSAQLAKRLGMTRAGVADLERREVAGNVTLHSLRKAAEAMDCVFVYFVVPRTNLQDTVQRQARQLVEQRQIEVSHSMQLEDQGLSEQERTDIINTRVEELVRTMPRTLWDSMG